jgi:hypothetical protein
VRRTAGHSRTVVVALASLLAVAVLAAPAHASRKATKAEAAAMKPAAQKPCADGPSGCSWHGARVSTANARFAWADVTGEGYSGALLKRPSKGSSKWRLVGTQGGGIGECRYWRKRAPDAVLRDLRIFGLVDRSGTTRNCGKR